jgi:hypothetical protein
VIALGVVLALVPATGLRAEEEAGSGLVPLIVGLLHESDKDLRALGLEQVRSEAKGAAATKLFAAELPKLSPEAQTGLLRALADRGDRAARPAVLELLAASKDEAVRVAAIETLPLLGEPDDVARLVQLLSGVSSAERAAARGALSRLPGEQVSAGLAGALDSSPPPLRAALIEILAARRAADQAQALLPWVANADPQVRGAAVTALAQLAGPPQVAALVTALLAAPSGPERQALERAIAQACGRSGDSGQKAAPLLVARASLPESDRPQLLSVLGRVGGVEALSIVEAAIADAKLRELGLAALCNWPDSSVALRLVELVAAEQDPRRRSMLLRALIRVAPLPDDRPPAEKLALMQTAMGLSPRDEDRNYVLQRSRAIRIPETLRFLRPYLDEPATAQMACESIVELAHHRTLRESAKPEFLAALDQVIVTSQDPVVVERATRYKHNQTWARPK